MNLFFESASVLTFDLFSSHTKKKKKKRNKQSTWEEKPLPILLFDNSYWKQLN